MFTQLVYDLLDFGAHEFPVEYEKNPRTIITDRTLYVIIIEDSSDWLGLINQQS